MIKKNIVSNDAFRIYVELLVCAAVGILQLYIIARGIQTTADILHFYIITRGTQTAVGILQSYIIAREIQRAVLMLESYSIACGI